MLDTLEVEDRVPNQPALHQTPTHRTGLQKGPPLCLRGAHGTHCGTSTAIFSVDKGKLGSPPLRHSHHRQSGKMRGTHTHCLKPILSTVTRENGKPSCEAHNRCPQSWVALQSSWSLSLFKRLLEFARGWKLGPNGLLLRPLEPTPVSWGTSWHCPSSDLCEFLGSVGLHGRSFQQLSCGSQKTWHLACLTEDPECNRGAASPPWWASDERIRWEPAKETLFASLL